MLSITALENAINYWRNKHPSDPVACAVCPQVNVLADVYALLIYEGRDQIAEECLTPEQQAALQIKFAAPLQRH